MLRNADRPQRVAVIGLVLIAAIKISLVILLWSDLNLAAPVVLGFGVCAGLLLTLYVYYLQRKGTQ